MSPGREGFCCQFALCAWLEHCIFTAFNRVGSEPGKKKNSLSLPGEGTPRELKSGMSASCDSSSPAFGSKKAVQMAAGVKVPVGECPILRSLIVGILRRETVLRDGIQQWICVQ